MSLKQVLNSVTKPCLGTAGIVPNRALSNSATAGNVQLMAATDQNFVGVALESNSKTGAVAVQTAGIATMENDGLAVITPGDKLVVAGTGVKAGRVKTQAIASGAVNLYQIVGECIDDAVVPATAGAIVSVDLSKSGLVTAA